VPQKSWRRTKKESLRFPLIFGAAEESRTLDLYLGKVSLYQLSYCRSLGLLPCCAGFCAGLPNPTRSTARILSQLSHKMATQNEPADRSHFYLFD
jgi:hypothetical protein